MFISFNFNLADKSNSDIFCQGMKPSRFVICGCVCAFCKTGLRISNNDDKDINFQVGNTTLKLHFFLHEIAIICISLLFFTTLLLLVLLLLNCDWAYKITHNN